MYICCGPISSLLELLFSFVCGNVIVIYDIEDFGKKENKIEPRIKLNHNIYACVHVQYIALEKHCD